MNLYALVSGRTFQPKIKDRRAEFKKPVWIKSIIFCTLCCLVRDKCCMNSSRFQVLLVAHHLISWEVPSNISLSLSFFPSLPGMPANHKLSVDMPKPQPNHLSTDHVSWRAIEVCDFVFLTYWLMGIITGDESNHKNKHYFGMALVNLIYVIHEQFVGTYRWNAWAFLPCLETHHRASTLSIPTAEKSTKTKSATSVLSSTCTQKLPRFGLHLCLTEQHGNLTEKNPIDCGKLCGFPKKILKDSWLTFMIMVSWNLNTMHFRFGECSHLASHPQLLRGAEGHVSSRPKGASKPRASFCWERPSKKLEYPWKIQVYVHMWISI